MEKEQNYKYQTGGDTSAECPESTINPQLDISNRDNAVADPNIAYNVTGGSQENACGNCALFDVSQRMKQCMQDGGETTGYCWSNQFKCEASAVCNNHQPGEPITEDEVSYDIAARYTEQQSPMEEPNMQPPEMIEPAIAMPEMQMARYGGAVRNLPKANYGNQGRMPYVKRNNTGERWRNDFARNNFAQWNKGNISGGTSLGDNGFGNLMGAVSNMFKGQKDLKNYKHNKNKFKRHNYTVDEDTDLDDFMVDPENPENVLSKAEYIKQQRELYKNNSYAEKYTDASGNPAVKFNFQNEGVIPTGANYMGVGDLYDNADWTGLTGNPTDWGWTTEGNNGGMYSTGNPVFTEKEVITTDRRYGGGLPKAQYFNSETGPTFSLSSNHRPITEGGFTNEMLNTPYQDLEFANYSTKKNTLGVTTPLGNEPLTQRGKRSNWFPYLNASVSSNDRETRHGTPGTPNSAGLDVGYTMDDWESKSGLEGDFNFELQNARQLGNRKFNTDSRINLGAQYVNDNIEPYMGGDFGINYNIGSLRNPKGSIKGGLDFRAPFRNTKRIDLGESTTGNNITLGRSRGFDQVGSGAQYVRPYVKGSLNLGKGFDVSGTAGWNVSSRSPEFGAGLNYKIGNRRNGGALPKAQWWNSFNDQPSNFEIPDYETILSNAGTTGNVTDFGNMSVGGNDNSNANTAGGWTPDGDPFGIGNDPFNMGDDPLGIRGESTFNNDGSQYTGSDWGDKFLEPGKNRRDYRKTQSGRLDDLTGKEKRQEKRKIKNESWDMNMDDQRDNRFGSAPLNKLNSFMDKKGVRKATRGLHDATNVIGALGAMKEASNRRKQNRDFRTNQTDSATISPVSYTDNIGFETKTGDFSLDNLVPESYQVKAGGEMQFGGSNMYAPKLGCMEKGKRAGLTGNALRKYIDKCKTEGNPDDVVKNPMYAYGGQPEMAMQQPEMAMQQPGMEEMAMQQPAAQSMQGDELVQEVTKVLQQGADPQAVMEELVQLGISQEEASQLIGSIMQQLQGQGQQMQMAQYGNMEQVYDVDDNVMEKLIAAGAGIEII